MGKEHEDRVVTFLEALEERGLQQLEDEKRLAKSLGDKIIITLKIWAFHIAGFFIRPIQWGIDMGLHTLLDIIGVGLAATYKPIFSFIRRQEACPEELKTLLDDIEAGGGEWQAMLGYSAGGAATGGLISSTIGPGLKLLEYEMLRWAISARLDPMMAVAAELRDPKWKTLVESDIKDQGWSEDRLEIFRLLAQTYMDASALTRYYFRYKDLGSEEIPDGHPYLEDMRRLGFTADEARRFRDISLFYPAPTDLVTWQAREVFEPEMVRRYGLDAEYEGIDKEPFFKAGMTEEQIRNYWRAHWEHASWIQVVEMLRRGLLTKEAGAPEPPTTAGGWEARDAEGREALYDWYRLVEIPPFWRDKLTAMSWAVPTRVDVRRWWDMRTIDEERLRSIYHSLGYHGKDLDDYVLWTKVYVAWPDLIARYTKGWISLGEVESELLALGMPPDRVKEMIETKVKKVAEERIAEELKLTKSEIIKGVKKGYLSWEQGLELLMLKGYSEWEAGYVLAINVGVESGSPETYSEFRYWVEWERAMRGEEAKLPPMELKTAEEAWRKARAKYEKLQAERAKENVLAEAATELSDAEYLYYQLLAKWKEGV